MVGISVGMKDGENVGERVVGLAVGFLDILGAIVEGVSEFKDHYFTDVWKERQNRTDLLEKQLVSQLD